MSLWRGLLLPRGDQVIGIIGILGLDLGLSGTAERRDLGLNGTAERRDLGLSGTTESRGLGLSGTTESRGLGLNGTTENRDLGQIGTIENRDLGQIGTAENLDPGLGGLTGTTDSPGLTTVMMKDHPKINLVELFQEEDFDLLSPAEVLVDEVLFLHYPIDFIDSKRSHSLRKIHWLDNKKLDDCKNQNITFQDSHRLLRM